MKWFDSATFLKDIHETIFFVIFLYSFVILFVGIKWNEKKKIFIYFLKLCREKEPKNYTENHLQQSETNKKKFLTKKIFFFLNSRKINIHLTINIRATKKEGT